MEDDFATTRITSCSSEMDKEQRTPDTSLHGGLRFEDEPRHRISSKKFLGFSSELDDVKPMFSSRPYQSDACTSGKHRGESGVMYELAIGNDMHRVARLSQQFEEVLREQSDQERFKANSFGGISNQVVDMEQPEGRNKKGMKQGFLPKAKLPLIGSFKK
eukprot:CAMPEP_0184691512 /NCGR_PEP_ID=MMETSP0313-20130426/345_1 /TAXON_ID=2792 /ORGANISM="Porphyridium aerugineum, Strain SAG 1380-2" /LENGTH=159 /DNA_ID=CAMNT_0027149245 /DNA_START=83 /DNA_END=562 /DNA_ORIENTATION=+